MIFGRGSNKPGRLPGDNNHISTYYKDDLSEYCKVCVDKSEEVYYYYILYYKENSVNWFHEECFPGKHISYVESAAENWALGIKTIEEPMYNGILLD
tara:strand:+ start:926 stop:1216 length:291 start_codon:yes stop_codon:yes gene_type:complete